MKRRPPRFLWLAASRPKAIALDERLPSYYDPMLRSCPAPDPDNDNARPVKTLSLDVERWIERQERR